MTSTLEPPQVANIVGRKVRKADQWIALWTYPVAILLLTGGLFLIGPLLPPISPSASPAGVAEVYANSADSIGIPIVILIVAIGAQVPLQGLVISYMRKMAGGGRILGLIYLVAYAAGMLPAAGMLATAWGCAVLRPDRDPELIRTLNDICYLGLIAVIGSFFVQYGSLALAIFLDRGRVLPLWFGYVSVWAAVSELLFVPAYLLHAGPFSWDGLLDFWMGLSLYGLWIVGLVIALTQAIKRSDVGSDAVVAS